MKKEDSDNKKFFTVEDIDYILSVIYSNDSDAVKAKKLYEFSDFRKLDKNIRAYRDERSKRLILTKEVLEQYKKYDAAGYFKEYKNTYKCSMLEFRERVESINRAYAIINSDASDYSKCESLLELYNSPYDLKKKYSLMIKNGQFDKKLDVCREALNHFDQIYNAFVEYRDRGIVSELKYINNNRSLYEIFPYAQYLINEYINSSLIYKSKFISEYGLDKDAFNFCVLAVRILDCDLYKKYLEKEDINKKRIFIANKETICDLAHGIETGILKDGTPFNVLEFVKRTPFKDSPYYSEVLHDFVSRNLPQYTIMILKYINDNNIPPFQAFGPLDKTTLNSVKTTINGVPITSEDNDIIFDYLEANDIPVVGITYRYVREKYLNGEITKSMVDETKKLQSNNKPIQRVLIPCVNVKKEA